jgi:ABC-type Na+ efflux pump permease subunit
MYEIWVVARNDIRKTFRDRSTYYFPILMVVWSLSYILGYSPTINALISQGASPQALYEASRSYFDTVIYLWPLVYCLFGAGISSNALILEKTGRNFEPLMVTPLSIRQIWAGKSLGTSVGGVIVGLGLFLIVFLGMSLGEVIPKTGVFVVPDVLPIITAIIIVPILVLGVILLITCIQLIIANPRTAMVIFIFILVGILIGITFATFYVKNPSYFILIYLGLIVIVGIVLYLVSRYLAPEKVVLSSKG